jgi:transcriptional regulator with XRE-family HTH domain
VAAGMDQRSAAAALKVRPGTVSAWEQGTSELAALDVPRIADLYKVDVAVIHGRAPMPEIKASETNDEE